MGYRFPAPKGYEHSPKANAYRAMRAAERLARYLDRVQVTHTHSNRLEEIDWYENFWDDSSHSELGVYTGNWNGLDTYDRQFQQRKDLPGGKWPEYLGKRLEKLGADVEWSDEHSRCGDCGKLIRTSCNSFDWRPDFHVGSGEITCIGCLLGNIGGVDDVIEGCASILWASVWADIADESGTYNLSGCEIAEHMPEIPEEAYAMARKVLADMLKQNEMDPGSPCSDPEAEKLREANVRTSVAKLIERALRADICDGSNSEGIPHFDEYAKRFGECMAFRAMGGGVGWEDDHAEVPGMEWSECMIGGSEHELDDLAAESLGAVYDAEQGKWVDGSEEDEGEEECDE